MRIMNIDEYNLIKNDLNISVNVEKDVKSILSDVKIYKDKALRKYSEKFDKVTLCEFEVSEIEIEEAFSQIDSKLLKTIKYSIENVRKFAKKQISQVKNFEIEMNDGVISGQKVIPINKVCVYVPGGNFPLFSSAIMGAVPASVVCVNNIYLSTPPLPDGKIPVEILVAGQLSGVSRFFKIGGAQAIGAFAYGTESIPKVDKIVGPGNKYVAEAKRQVFGEIGIDMIAGPTELLVIADDSANLDFVVSDLLAQAEHDVDANVMLITYSKSFAEKIQKRILNYLEKVECPLNAKESILNNGIILISKDDEQTVAIANEKAPEHLSLQLKNTTYFEEKLTNYGSLFIGENACEAVADYSAGINHTLPTNKNSRFTGGLSVFDFIKFQTTLKLKESFDKELFENAYRMSKAEGLKEHGHSILKRIGKG